MKTLFLLPLLAIRLASFAQNNDELVIRNILDKQTKSWNRGDLEGFMQGYWKNDSLMFIGKSGINWGWEKTLANYKRSYPDTAAMGKLSFEILLVRKLSPAYYFVVGKWMLKRTAGDLSGCYDLLFRKINGEWFIVSDHSS